MLPKRVIYIGEDGSMGLSHGEKYHITLEKGDYKGKEHIWARIIGVFGEYTYCPYASEELLLKNWAVEGGLSDGYRKD